jgi:hypothetical protein
LLVFFAMNRAQKRLVRATPSQDGRAIGNRRTHANPLAPRLILHRVSSFWLKAES